MKRLHKKTRTGCDRCRRRRVKCDEASPNCGNCSRRKEECYYSCPLPIHGLRLPPITFPSASPTPPVSHPVHYGKDDSQVIQLTLPRSPARLRELELMQQWCTQTSLCTRAEFVELLRGCVVHKALQHGYLMDSILALSSLHIASEAQRATEACENVVAALHYQNQSIAGLGKTLRSISRDNCDAVLLTSTFNMICVLLAPLLPATSNYQIETTANMILRVRDHAMGTVSILDHYADWIREGSLAPFFQIAPTRRLGAIPLFVFDILRLLNNAILANVPKDSRVFSVMQNAVDRLETVYVHSNGTSVFPWLIVAGLEFFRELERCESVALVIVMCWGALVHSLDQVWWTTYTGRRVVEELSRVIKTRDGEWNQVTQWCLDQVQKPGKSS